MTRRLKQWLEEIHFAFAELHKIQFAAPWRRPTRRC